MFKLSNKMSAVQIARPCFIRVADKIDVCLAPKTPNPGVFHPGSLGGGPVFPNGLKIASQTIYLTAAVTNCETRVNPCPPIERRKKFRFVSSEQNDTPKATILTLTDGDPDFLFCNKICSAPDANGFGQSKFWLGSPCCHAFEISQEGLRGGVLDQRERSVRRLIPQRVGIPQE
jgi:hypothetical protein